MKQKYTLGIFVLLTVVVLSASVLAVNPAAYNGLKDNGKSSVNQLYLFEKNSDWEIVEDGAWGKMIYNENKDKFVFNGHMLEENMEYSLIYYPNPWPGTGTMVLGTAEADEEGDVHIKGTFDFLKIPTETDENYNEGAKIWLVTSESIFQVEGEDYFEFNSWMPEEYLFEYDLI